MSLHYNPVDADDDDFNNQPTLVPAEIEPKKEEGVLLDDDNGTNSSSKRSKTNATVSAKKRIAD